MNGEDIYNGITDLPDGQIEVPENKPRQTRRFRRFIPFAAAAAAIVIAFGAFIFVRGGGETGLSVGPKANVLAMAEYPERAKYSEYDPDFWAANVQERMERNAETNKYSGKLDGFMEKLIPELLSGSDGKNRVCSPLNIYMALSMLAETADGETREQILGLLDCENIEEVRERASAVWNANYEDSGLITCLLGHSVWLNQKMSYKKNTVKSLAENYYASTFRGKMGSEEYNSLLRNWADLNTGGLLSDKANSLGFDESADIAAVLMSTIYYQARWNSEFWELNNSEKTFHSPSGDVTAEFMNKTFDYGDYYWGDGFSATCLSIRDGGKMWLILPDEGTDVDSLLASGAATDFLENTDQWQNRKELTVDLSLPKFDIYSSFDISESLSKLGINDAFDPARADLSMLTEDSEAFVSKVEHTVRLRIDEEGVEGAAITELAIAGAGEPQDFERIEFNLDRPFIVAVTSGADGYPLFAGVVNEVGGL